MTKTDNANSRYELMERLGMESLSAEEFMTAIANWFSNEELEDFLCRYFGYDTDLEEDEDGKLIFKTPSESPGW